MVLWLDAARGLRELYPAPEHRIVLLADIAGAALARSQCDFDVILEVDHARFSKSPLYRWRLVRVIADQGFSTALNPAGWQDCYVADSIVAASRASRRIGWSLRACTLSERCLLGWRAGRYSHLLASAPENLSALRLNASFVQELGHRYFEPRAPKLKLGQPLHYAAGTSLSTYYLLCPGATDPRKRWPAERFAEVARRIFAATGMRGSVCGTVAEKQLARDICKLADAPLSDLTGLVSVEQFAQYAAGASLLIANDSGALHIGAASGAPTLCIEGGGTPGWCVPYDAPAQEGRILPQAVWHRMDCFGCNWHCRYKISPRSPAPCIANVTVEQVAAGALAILRARPSLDQERTREKI